MRGKRNAPEVPEELNAPEVPGELNTPEMRGENKAPEVARSLRRSRCAGSSGAQGAGGRGMYKGSYHLYGASCLMCKPQLSINCF